VRDVSNAAIEDKVKSWLRQTQYNWIGTAKKHLMEMAAESVAMKLPKLVSVSDCLKMTTSSRRLTMKTRRSSIATVERL